MAGLCYRKLALCLTLKLCYNNLIFRQGRMFKPNGYFFLNMPENQAKNGLRVGCRH